MKGAAGTPEDPSLSSSEAVRQLAQFLAAYAQQEFGNHDFFSHLCIALSRELDYAIVNGQVPAIVSELPAIFKLVCQRKNEYSLHAAITVLLVTVTNACKAQWFSSQENQELVTLADKMIGLFCITEGYSYKQADIIPTVSKIIPRYYPQLKVSDVLVSVAIKPGFQSCAVDFYIPKIVHRASTERIHLLVAIKDKTDTSSCIVNPLKVEEFSILLNGVGLQEKIVGCMHHGPQHPPIINHMLRYGTNLLQVFGHFDAPYIVLIAYMSFQPFDHPPASVVDSEAEIVEGTSTISRPISLKCIGQSVQGPLCKHLQIHHPDTSVSTIRCDESHIEVCEGLLQGQEETAGMGFDLSNFYHQTESCDEMISLDVNPPEDQRASIQPEAIRNPVNQVQGTPSSGPVGNSSAQSDCNKPMLTYVRRKKKPC